MAASTTERASLIGSDVFLAGSFFFLAFGFGMGLSCQSRSPFASPSQIQTLPVPALASCINITLRMSAHQHGWAHAGVTTGVQLDRSNPKETIFEYEVELQGTLSEQDRARLLSVAATCPVRRTLSKRMGFRAG